MRRSSRAIVIFLALAVGSCEVWYSSCSADGSCRKQYLTSGGIEYVDSETGVRTKGATIDRLATSSEYRYSVKYNAKAAGSIPHAEALNYLARAAQASDRQWRVCGYDSAGVLFAGITPLIAFDSIEIIPARGSVLNAEDYVVFLRYSPGPFASDIHCVAYRRVRDGQADSKKIDQEMEWVVEALLSLGAKMAE